MCHRTYSEESLGMEAGLDSLQHQYRKRHVIKLIDQDRIRCVRHLLPKYPSCYTSSKIVLKQAPPVQFISQLCEHLLVTG